MGHQENLQYLASFQGENFNKISIQKIYEILSNAETPNIIQQYVDILEQNFATQNMYNSKYDPTGFTVGDNMDDFNRLIAPGIIANKAAPTHMIEKLYSSINFNRYSSEKAATIYYNLAGNPNTPTSILQKYCSKHEPLYHNPQILEALTGNPSIKLEWLMEEQFLKKINSKAAYVVAHIVAKKQFTREHAKHIIYGDYSEQLVMAMIDTAYATPEDKTYATLKFGPC
jgi:hypothetical protein